jgi:hypothetical protein
MPVTFSGLFVVNRIDRIEKVIERRTETIAQPAPITYIDNPDKFLLKIRLLPIEWIVRVEYHHNASIKKGRQI